METNSSTLQLIIYETKNRKWKACLWPFSKFKQKEKGLWLSQGKSANLMRVTRKSRQPVLSKSFGEGGSLQYVFSWNRKRWWDSGKQKFGGYLNCTVIWIHKAQVKFNTVSSFIHLLTHPNQTAQLS